MKYNLFKCTHYFHHRKSFCIQIAVPEEGGYKDIVVEIERTTRNKPYLGGYKHKKTSVEYHHASAQTMQKPRIPTNVPRFCRDTQTVEQRHRVQQTTNETSTQMTKIGVYMTNLSDKLIPPGRYVTADEHLAMLLSKVSADLYQLKSTMRIISQHLRILTRNYLSIKLS